MRFLIAVPLTVLLACSGSSTTPTPSPPPTSVAPPAAPPPSLAPISAEPILGQVYRLAGANLAETAATFVWVGTPDASPCSAPHTPDAEIGTDVTGDLGFPDPLVVWTVARRAASSNTATLLGEGECSVPTVEEIDACRAGRDGGAPTPMRLVRVSPVGCPEVVAYGVIGGSPTFHPLASAPPATGDLAALAASLEPGRDASTVRALPLSVAGTALVTGDSTHTYLVRGSEVIRSYVLAPFGELLIGDRAFLLTQGFADRTDNPALPPLTEQMLIPLPTGS